MPKELTGTELNGLEAAAVFGLPTCVSPRGEKRVLLEGDPIVEKADPAARGCTLAGMPYVVLMGPGKGTGCGDGSRGWPKCGDTSRRVGSAPRGDLAKGEAPSEGPTDLTTVRVVVRGDMNWKLPTNGAVAVAVTSPSAEDGDVFATSWLLLATVALIGRTGERACCRGVVESDSVATATEGRAAAPPSIAAIEDSACCNRWSTSLLQRSWARDMRCSRSCMLSRSACNAATVSTSAGLEFWCILDTSWVAWARCS